MNADGTGQRQLITSPGTDSDPSWSPDGKKIAFNSGRDDGENQFQFTKIYVMNADGSGQHRITDGPLRDLYPSWSPVPLP